MGLLAATIELWILAAVLFLGGEQLISVGILGRYLARVHEQALQRPLYLVSRVIRGDNSAGTVSSRPLPHVVGEEAAFPTA